MNEVTKISRPRNPEQAPPLAFLIDLVLVVSVMFLIREVYFSRVGFLVNGLFWSLSTLAVAFWRMRARGISFGDLGLRKPSSYGSALLATFVALGSAIALIVVFQVLQDQWALEIAADQSNESAVARFGDLYGNWPLFLSILPAVWLESMLEEVLDRGFLITWLENAMANTVAATIVAVIAQAMLFGFRHSNDLSERSITVGLIGLAMGVVYVAFGRNLWPLVIAHCTLNTISMMDRVT